MDIANKIPKSRILYNAESLLHIKLLDFIPAEDNLLAGRAFTQLDLGELLIKRNRSLVIITTLSFKFIMQDTILRNTNWV